MSIDQSCKQTAGKPRISLVPPALVTEVAKVRTWATENKYADPENWRQVPESWFLDAIGRHYLAYLENPDGTDAESGLSHMAHIATNAAFILELRKGGNNATRP